MRTFFIALAVFILFVTWLLHKPLPQQSRVAREFTDAEIEYLEKSFNYAMDSLKEGEFFDWSAAAVNGRISVGKPYISPQKATCRDYVEVARTLDSQKVDAAIACKRQGKGGWCRVYGENPQSCALEVAESSVKKRARFAILQGSQMIDSLLGTRVGVNTDGMAPTTPKVGMPALGGLPEVEAPELDHSDFRPPMPWDPPKKE